MSDAAAAAQPSSTRLPHALAILLCGPTLSLKTVLATYLARRLRLPHLAAATLEPYPTLEHATAAVPTQESRVAVPAFVTASSNRRSRPQQTDAAATATCKAEAARTTVDRQPRTIDAATRERRRALLRELVGAYTRLGLSLIIDDGFNRAVRRHEVYRLLQTAGRPGARGPARPEDSRLGERSRAYHLLVIECTCSDREVLQARNDARRGDPLASEDPFTDEWVDRLHRDYEPVTEAELSELATGLTASLIRFDSARPTFPLPPADTLPAPIDDIVADLHAALADGRLAR